MLKHPHLSRVVTAALTFTLGPVAFAEQPTAPGFALSRFEPSECGSWFFTSESLDDRTGEQPAFVLVADDAYRPLVLYKRTPGGAAGVPAHVRTARLRGRQRAARGDPSFRAVGSIEWVLATAPAAGPADGDNARINAVVPARDADANCPASASECHVTVGRCVLPENVYSQEEVVVRGSGETGCSSTGDAGGLMALVTAEAASRGRCLPGPRWRRARGLVDCGPMAINVTAPSLDPVTRAVERPGASAQGTRVGDAVRVGEGTREVQSPGGTEMKLATAAARGLGERLVAEDANGDTLAEAAESLNAAAAARTEQDRAAALAKLDEAAAANPAAGVDREKLGVNGSPDAEAMARAQEAVAQARADSGARRAALVREAEAAAERLSGTKLRTEDQAAEAAARVRQQISGDAVAAVQAQANQAQASAQSLLS